MTWSPGFTLVTPAPTSSTTPAPSWPKMTGNSPSGSAPERVNSSVWQTPVALISTSTSPVRGPSSSTSSTTSGLPASYATAARVFMAGSLYRRSRPRGRSRVGTLGPRWWRWLNRPYAPARVRRGEAPGAARVSREGARPAGVRKVEHYCQGGDGEDGLLEAILRAISDCAAILVDKIGRCPRERL